MSPSLQPAAAANQISQALNAVLGTDRFPVQVDEVAKEYSKGRFPGSPITRIHGEDTGERIRDKFAASKRKGIWMGGIPPLGYDVKNRRLVPNEAEAKLVRHIFRRFVELGSGTLRVKELKLDGATSKAWTTQDGRVAGSTRPRAGTRVRGSTTRIRLGAAVWTGPANVGGRRYLTLTDLPDGCQVDLRNRPSLAAVRCWRRSRRRLGPGHRKALGGTLQRRPDALALQWY